MKIWTLPLKLSGNQAAMTTGRKLAIASIFVASAIIYLAYLGAAESWQYYLTVDECIKDASTQSESRLRINGKVAAGSLQIAADRRNVSFVLQGEKESLEVAYKGPIPDNLAENINVVVEGRLDGQKKFLADKVLTRCASKYKSQNAVSSTAAKSKPEVAL
jgi:cytochrome c-type biogenesis protein CcmE